MDKLQDIKIRVYLEACAGATVLPALGVEGEQLAGQDPGQGLLLVGRVVHASSRLSTTSKKKILCYYRDQKLVLGSLSYYYM